MLIAGAIGTYFGGRVVDRLGRRRLVVGFTALAGPRAGRLRALPVRPGGRPARRRRRLRHHRDLLGLGRHGPGVPAHALGLASGVTMGLAIGVGGIAAAGMGAVADAFGLGAVMWLIVAITVPLFVLARTLPVTRAERRAQGLAAAPRPTAAARPVTAPGFASLRRPG